MRQPRSRACCARRRTGRSERSGKPERELRHAAVLRDDLRRGAVPVEPHRRPEPRLAEAKAQIHDARRRARSRRSARRRARNSATCRHALLAVHHPRARAVQAPAAERADADPERRRRPAHADGERARSRGADPGLPPAGGARTSATRCSAATSAVLEQGAAGAVRSHADQALHRRAADLALLQAGAAGAGAPVRCAARAGQPRAARTHAATRSRSRWRTSRARSVQALGALESGNIGTLPPLRTSEACARAGRAPRAGSSTLHDYSYVPGVTVSGEITQSRPSSIGGPAAAHGTLRLRSAPTLAGTLGGKTCPHRRAASTAISPRVPLLSGCDAQAQPQSRLWRLCWRMLALAGWPSSSLGLRLSFTPCAGNAPAASPARPCPCRSTAREPCPARSR